MNLRGIKRVGAWVVLSWMTGAAMPVCASELQPLEIAIVKSDGKSYVEPADRSIVIRRQPINLFVRIRNTSRSSILVRVHPEKAYAVELKSEAGLTSLVQRKKESGKDAGDDVRKTLPAGGEMIISMEITRDAWEGVPELPAGQKTTYMARVVYETTDAKHVYSESYTIVFDIPK